MLVRRVARVVENDPSPFRGAARFELHRAREKAGEQRGPIGGANRNAADVHRLRGTRRAEPCGEIVQRHQQALPRAAFQHLTKRRAVLARRIELSCRMRLVLLERATAVACGEHRIFTRFEVGRRAVERIAYETATRGERPHLKGRREPGCVVRHH
jgi:hypothetical protein